MLFSLSFNSKKNFKKGRNEISGQCAWKSATSISIHLFGCQKWFCWSCYVAWLRSSTTSARTLQAFGSHWEPLVDLSDWMDGWMGRKRKIEGVWCLMCDVSCVCFFWCCLELKNHILRKTCQQQNQQTNPKTILLPRCFFFSEFVFCFFFFRTCHGFFRPQASKISKPPQRRGDESILWGVGSSWLEFSIGNPSSIRVHLPASYVSLLEGSRLGFVFCVGGCFLRIRFDGRFITIKRHQPFGWNHPTVAHRIAGKHGDSMSLTLGRIPQKNAVIEITTFLQRWWLSTLF